MKPWKGRAAVLALAGLLACSRPPRPLPEPSAAKLPAWRGFNLDEKQELEEDRPYREEDFRLMAEWGFDFARLPLDYRIFAEEGRPERLKEAALLELDQALAWGRRYGVHVDISFHRAPGYCVNAPREALDLWKDERAQRLAAGHWAALARRYKGVPNANLSFNLLNEPKLVGDAAYAKVMRRLAAAVRAEDPSRLLIVDGLDLASRPVLSLADLGVAQSLHAYLPWEISHYRAPWMDEAADFAEPAWPLVEAEGPVRDKESLRRFLEPWRRLEALGVGVHVGEFGAFNKTPHPVTLAWMRDSLELFRELGWGWALWNLRGEYGPLDSGRADVDYRDFRGRKLDREMLELLRAR